MTTRAQQTKAAIAALGSTPDVDVARRTLAEWDVRDQAAALISTAGGRPVVLGPYEVDFSDIPQYLDELELFELPVGTLVMDWWTDPETGVIFVLDQGEDPDFTASSSIRLGQGTPFVDGSDAGAWGYVDFLDTSDNSPPDLTTNVTAQDHYNRNGDLLEKNGLIVIEDADPVRVVNTNNSAFDLNAGHSDLYFMVATPTLTVPT